MPVLPAIRIWPLLLLLAVRLGVAVGAPQPWRCAPCSAERLALCPPLPASCSEPARPAGCGCCPMCALPLGAACGVATARCASGLSCRALPGEPRPLYALTRGQGACMPESDNTALSAEATDAEGPAARETVSPDDPGAAEMTQERLLGISHPVAPSGEDPPVPRRTLSDQESVRAHGGTDVQQWKAAGATLARGRERAWRSPRLPWGSRGARCQWAWGTNLHLHTPPQQSPAAFPQQVGGRRRLVSPSGTKPLFLSHLAGPWCF
ncbi:insulin-like growth factor-binding protein 1 isoform X2 [Artibeus jamaicensis]|uniref:insulin-like growth factor-binding protein 1 isoform X2 n=1 Tax=Artibeus jamaicensis TaxID=9417 RepID=UPI00235B0252|nr:insulin-like growth factor-binding protein 1 isoform X2 [Artibeus jamaicensis]